MTSWLRAAVLAAALFVFIPNAGIAETPTPETKAAARELIDTIHFADQFNAMLPMFMDNLKPAVAQGRPEVEKDFMALTPILIEGFKARVGELSDSVAAIYAEVFTAAELRAVIEFYRTPAGKKFLEKTPELTQRTMAVGQKFGQSVAQELSQRMIEELRKRGHAL